MSNTPVRKRLRDTYPALVLILSLLAMRSSLADQYVVPTGSMEPTIHPGDRIAVNKMAYDLRTPFAGEPSLRVSEPTRGDVVVFRYPRDPAVTMVKRLVGLPGDVVRVRDGEITLNGKPVPQQEGVERLGQVVHGVRREPGHPDPGARDEQVFVVPRDAYFVMGDNRDNSFDGRSWGFVPRTHLRGKALRVFFPEWRDAGFAGT